MKAELEALLLGELVDSPIAMLLHFEQAVRLQVAQVLGDVDLRFLEHRLKMADAKWRLREQVQDAEPRLVAEALVDFNQLHRNNMPLKEYTAKSIFCAGGAE